MRTRYKAAAVLVIVLVIIIGSRANASPEDTKPKPEPAREEIEAEIISVATRAAAAVQELQVTEATKPEYIPSTKAAAGYISELELIELTEEIGNQYHVSPELLQAMAETESTLQIEAINGDCKGLMQISERWHLDRMERLGVTDIYDPRSNILLAADYLAELYEINPDTYYVLMRYNMQTDTAERLYAAGEYSYYATSIVKRAEELERLHGK